MTPPVGRRGFLALGAATAATVGLAGHASATTRLRANPFTCGVASGEPRPSAVVIWTRLALEPYADDGLAGMPDSPITVFWKVATDERFATVVRTGAMKTTPDIAHSVHVDVKGLEPGREYFYQFRTERHLSEVGRTKTAKAGAGVRDLTFAFASCQSFTQGYFNCYPHMVADDPDVVFFLGDYIYRQPGANAPPPHLPERPVQPQRRCETLADFRIRYAQYHREEGLAEAHRMLPWVVTIDDNEIDNNWFGTDTDPVRTARRIAGMQAFWENMPLLPSSRPQGWQLPGAYRRLSYGDLVDFHAITTRHYRTQLPTGQCAPGEQDGGYCPDELDPARTILGDEQERWLLEGLRDSGARWNVLANQVFFSPRDVNGKPGEDERTFSHDAWDGYVSDRQAILDTVNKAGRGDFVVITGDTHRNWVMNTPPNFREWDGTAAPVATELGVTSVTSGAERPPNPLYLPDPVNNPHMLYRDDTHGYALARMTRDELRTDFRAVPTLLQPQVDIETISSWKVVRGTPGATQV